MTLKNLLIELAAHNFNCVTGPLEASRIYTKLMELTNSEPEFSMGQEVEWYSKVVVNEQHYEKWLRCVVTGIQKHYSSIGTIEYAYVLSTHVPQQYHGPKIICSYAEQSQIRARKE